jgi:hypothetical protein
MISVFNDYCADHLSNRDEEFKIYFIWEIENERLATE